MFYLKELYNNDEIFADTTHTPKFIQNIIITILKLLNLLIIKENIIILPYKKDELKKISKRKFKKYYKKIRKFFYEEGANTIAISNALNKLKNIQRFKNLLYSNNYHILNGRWIFKHLSFEILEFISKETKLALSKIEISILTNSYNEFICDNIRLLAQNVKKINIVTPNIAEFRHISQELYNSFGISIRLSYNKRKILTNSNVILNFDFPEEIINKFALPLDGILVNFSGRIKLNNKLFNGLNINYYEIRVHKNIIKSFRQVNLLDAFDLEILYESLYYTKTTFSKTLAHILEDNLHITALVGNKGGILKSEYKTPNKAVNQ